MESKSKDIIVLLKDGTSFDTKRGENINLVILKHPKGHPVIFGRVNELFLELQQFQGSSGRHGSWFINQRISSDSHYYAATKMDPRYLVLPYLEKNGSRYSPLDQMVTVEEGCARLPLAEVDTWRMEDVCDVNNKLGDIILYRYNEQKVLDWLVRKTASISAVVMRQRLVKDRATGCLLASNFNASGQSRASNSSSTAAADSSVEETPSRSDTVTAAQLLCEYLTDSLARLLLKALSLTEADVYPTAQQVTHKRKADWEVELEVEKETASFSRPLPTASPASSTVSASASAPAAAAGRSISSASPTSSTPAATSRPSPAPPKKKTTESNSKAAAGTKSISSFFAKK